MAYNNAIPQSSDRIKDSQSQLLENFATISALLGVNHVISPWTSPATGNEGKHNFVTFPEQSSAPTVSANEVALYTEDVSGETHLFFRNSSFAFDISEPGIGSAGGVSTFSLNLMQLFTGAGSNLILKTGQTSASAIAQDGNTTVTYPVTFPVATAHVMVTPLFASASSTQRVIITLLSFTATGFTVRMDSIGSSASGACDLHFFAIGR